MVSLDRLLRITVSTRRVVVLACTGLLLIGAIGWSVGFAYTPERETDRVVAHLRGVPITVYTYRPNGCADPALLFVFHGLGRNAVSYRNSARRMADETCMVVFVPFFDKERFPSWRYQRGGLTNGRKLLPKEQWSVAMVSDLIEWARVTEGNPRATYYLFGHSAGAQFLSRVAAFDPPLDAARIVIANPSTYVLPSTKEPAPYGLGGVFDPAEGERQLRTYLQLPITIYLGELDTGDEDLAQTPAAMQQGENRLRRGLFAYRSAKSIAQAKGWDFRWRLVTAPGVGHTARGMLHSSKFKEAFDLKGAEMAQ